MRITCSCKVAQAVECVDKYVVWWLQVLQPSHQDRYCTASAPALDAVSSRSASSQVAHEQETLILQQFTLLAENLASSL